MATAQPEASGLSPVCALWWHALSGDAAADTPLIDTLRPKRPGTCLRFPLLPLAAEGEAVLTPAACLFVTTLLLGCLGDYRFDLARVALVI
jgi:hypothetical protein